MNTRTVMVTLAVVAIAIIAVLCSVSIVVALEKVRIVLWVIGLEIFLCAVAALALGVMGAMVVCDVTKVAIVIRSVWRIAKIGSELLYRAAGRVSAVMIPVKMAPVFA